LVQLLLAEEVLRRIIKLFDLSLAFFLHFLSLHRFESASEIIVKVVMLEASLWDQLAEE
jgi:hypothetical protein